MTDKLSCIPGRPTLFSYSWSVVLRCPQTAMKHIFGTLGQYAPHLLLSQFKFQAIQTLLCNTEMLTLPPDATTVMHVLSFGGKNRCATMPAPRHGSPVNPISVSHSPKRDTTRKIGASSGPVAHTILLRCASYPPGIYKFVLATSAKPT